MSKGILILVPTGSNKTLFFLQLDSKTKKKWLDGDVLLNQFGIKNNINFWYNNNNCEKNQNIIKRINKIFFKATLKGFNIIFTGNPLLLTPDVIIYPNLKKRWKNNRKKESMGQWSPNEVQFNLENKAFKQAFCNVQIIINGDIPNIDLLNNISQSLNKKTTDKYLYS